MASSFLKKIKNRIQDIPTGAYLFSIIIFVLTTVITVGSGVFMFSLLIEQINRAVSDEPPPAQFGQGVNFRAIDAIALKLGIEIPARNIPSQKFLFANKPPLIFNFTSVRTQVLPQDTVPVFLNVFDPDGDELEVDWIASGGPLNPISPLGPARWTAPSEPGRYTLTVTITDQKVGHQPVSASLSMRVLPKIPDSVSPEELPQYTTRLVGLVKEEGSQDLYLVKSEGNKLYKRLLPSPEIVNYYPDLNLNNIQIMPRGVLTEYITSSWVRGRERYRVYQINKNGEKQWLNMTWDQFLERGGSDESIFTVNDEEVNFYPNGTDVLASDVPPIETLAIPPAYIAVTENQRLEVENKDQLFQAIKDISIGSFPNRAPIRIVPKIKDKEYMNLEEFLTALKVIIPNNLVSLWEENFTFFLYREDTQNMFGLVVKARVGTDPVRVSQGLTSWEPAMPTDLTPLYTLSGLSQGSGSETTFAGGSYRGIPLRFLNLGNQNLAIDYSFMEARNLIVITTSRASMFSTLDGIIGQ